MYEDLKAQGNLGEAALIALEYLKDVEQAVLSQL